MSTTYETDIKVLKSYLHSIGKEEDDTCPRCLNASETLEHVLWSCPAGDQYRSMLLKTDGRENREVLWDDPEKAMKFLRESGVMPPSSN